MLSSLAASSGLANLPSLELDFPRAGMNLKYVVHFPAGGMTDVIARIVAQRISQEWKLPFLVENKAGSSGQIGADQVAKGPSDGSQILAITLAHPANSSLFPTALYSFVNDLRPVAQLASSPILVVVPANSPIPSLKDLILAARWISFFPTSLNPSRMSSPVSLKRWRFAAWAAAPCYQRCPQHLKLYARPVCGELDGGHGA